MQSQHYSGQPVAETVVREDETPLKVLAAGSTGEVVAGIAAVVLAILGLAHVLPFYMITIATICAGGALFLEGTAIAAQYNDLEREINRSTKTHVALGGGMAFEILGGIAGIALGILALVGVDPTILVPVAAIAMGAALVLGAGATERLDKIRAHYYSVQDPVAQWTHGGIMGAAGTQVLCGLAAIALGILALIGFAPTVLSLIAMLCIGGSVFLAGLAVTGKTSALLGHHH